MYGRLHRSGDHGHAFGICPTCQRGVEVDRDLRIVRTCPHLRRVWKVSVDNRIRVEWGEPRERVEVAS